MAVTKPRERGTGQQGVRGGFPFLIVLALWAFIGWALLFDQQVLADVWNEFRDLHIVLQVVGWVLFLPWLGAIAIWGADWALWLRVLLIGLIALSTLIGFAPRRRS